MPNHHSSGMYTRPRMSKVPLWRLWARISSVRLVDPGIPGLCSGGGIPGSPHIADGREHACLRWLRRRHQQKRTGRASTHRKAFPLLLADIYSRSNMKNSRTGFLYLIVTQDWKDHTDSSGARVAELPLAGPCTHSFTLSSQLAGIRGAAVVEEHFGHVK